MPSRGELGVVDRLGGVRGDESKQARLGRIGRVHAPQLLGHRLGAVLRQTGDVLFHQCEGVLKRVVLRLFLGRQPVILYVQIAVMRQYERDEDLSLKPLPDGLVLLRGIGAEFRHAFVELSKHGLHRLQQLCSLYPLKALGEEFVERVKKDVRPDEAGIPRLAVGGIGDAAYSAEVGEHLVV